MALALSENMCLLLDCKYTSIWLTLLTTIRSMRIEQLGTSNTVLNSFLREIRDVTIQNDPMRFRRNIERIGEILAYEMSRAFVYKERSITTPLGEKNVSLMQDALVVCSVLRAGLPLQSGLMNYFDHAESAFISAYRKHDANGKDFKIEVEYVACPDLSNKTLILADPMLATGQSMALTYEALRQYGSPSAVHLVSVIGAKAGVEYVEKNFPNDTSLWIAEIDDTLNDKGYIVPGLGDAGDLAFGKKLQQ